MTQAPAALLIIAGSDPSGGAGIQADLKTAATIGVYGAAAITSLTVQNTEGVFSANPVEPSLVKEQVEKVLADLPVSHIKTGMLGNSGITGTVGEILARFEGVVVCDPILHSSSGKSLLEGASVHDLRKHIISRATAITPNFPELKALSGHELANDDDMRYAVERLFTKHPALKVVVVKGGHRDMSSAEVSDFLFRRTEGEILESRSARRRVTTSNTHGTGCTFATALTAYHMQTGDWTRSFELAGEYVQEILIASAGIQLGKGTGPLQHHLFSR
ncbi:MAG: bifunctional hydroxymethylpyrimidine kinase/phosphomethylpyrimidine kinase [Proteobacteria bacterium]|nr:bifunctional hydroxymethylpyrimidine kinase/phosphomethylpyrimidine kinase [Pseudomonadota bacterium]MBU1736622.1 bifunctional hydroxymethylpyrimidine kinase/phosphomethylpyrimidine kinase [Pseudomonadota bacterium]